MFCWCLLWRVSMRIDSGIVRQILEAVERTPSPYLEGLPHCADDELVELHHLRALVEGGFLVCRTDVTGCPLGFSLTFAGQQLLDELRASPGFIRTLGECAERVATGVAVGWLVAKARAAAMLMHG
jgi:hypothetical protein